MGGSAPDSPWTKQGTQAFELEAFRGVLVLPFFFHMAAPHGAEGAVPGYGGPACPSINP